MLRYTIHRLLLMIPTLLGVAVLVFVLLRMLPGDIVELRFLIDGGQVTPEVLAAERAAARPRQVAVVAVLRLDDRHRSSAISASRCGPAAR